MSDEVFPDSVKDFVFDLHDTSRRSFIASEEQALYSGTFREITAKVSEVFCVGRTRRAQIIYVLVLIFVVCLSSMPTTPFLMMRLSSTFQM